MADDSIISSHQSKICLTLKKDLFCSFFNPVGTTNNEKACVVEIARDEINKDLLTALFEEVEAHLGVSVAHCQMKLVGTSSAVALMKVLLLEFQVPLHSSTIREVSGSDIIFHLDNGRLQVALPPSLERKIKVLIVDDSATIRKLLVSILSRDSEIEVVAVAERPSQVESLIQQHKPDVITLDIHMPEMDGVTLLKTFFPKYPTPVVIITSLSMEEGPLVLDALENGAVEYIQKPLFENMDQMAPLIIEKIKIASKAKLKTSSALRLPTRRLKTMTLDHGVVIAIGSSTGGTEALKEIFIRLPENIPPIVVVQHIPQGFSLAFAKRMNDLCPFEVKEAENGDEVISNRVLIAPGGKQMSLSGSRGQLKIVITDPSSANPHNPSVDVLFNSVAECMGKRAVGVILTGMGADGAHGMLKMKEKGARTVAQDEASCVVFGMPKEAIRLGAAQEIKPLFEIPELLVKWLSKSKAA